MADSLLDDLSALSPIPGAAILYFVSGGVDYQGSVSNLFIGRTLSATVALGIRSTGAAFDLQIGSSEVLTANRALSIVLGDAARTLTIGASASVSGSNTGDQTITLTGNVTGSGTGSFATTIANSAVTNAMLAGSIAISKLSITGTPDGTKYLRDDGSWQAIAGGGDALVANPLSQFAATTSAQLRGVISDENGTGALLFSGATSPVFVTPDLGTPSALVLTSATGLPPATGIVGWPANSAGVLTNNGSGTLSWGAAGSGTVTHTGGALTASRLVLGAGSDDVNVLGSLGTTTTVLHGNAAGAPTFGAIVAADISSFVGFPVELGVALSDLTTDLTTGTSKASFRLPYAMTLTEVRLCVDVAPTGSTLIVDVNENTVSVFSTRVSIDAGEDTSTTAATAQVISDAALAANSKITFDIDQVGSSVAGRGLVAFLIGVRA